MEVSLAQLPAFAQNIAAALPKTAGAGAYIIGLSGNLGAGKTAFVQEFAKALGVSASITSPTFILAQRYPIYRPPFENLIHVDAYRLSPDEKDTFGWSGYRKDPKNLIVAEWPERLPGGVPEGAHILAFTVTGEDTRDVSEKHVETK